MIGRPAAMRGHVCATRRGHRSQGSDSAGGFPTMAAFELAWSISRCMSAPQEGERHRAADL